jgi:CubicO group peptidase (beta-lactamase class C family)
MTADGTCDPAFEPVRAALDNLITSGRDVGCCAAVVHQGRLVADVWAGHQDEARTIPWERDTIINVWSTTKTMTNLSALILAAAGELDLDAPVGTYWPEFKASGKDGVLVRHLLSHTAGLPAWSDDSFTGEDLYDWEKSTALLAADAPWWEPGTAAGYHLVTQGYLVGEVVRRVTGQSLGTWFDENVAGPLGADFHIGTGAEHDDRVAKVIPPPSLAEQLVGADPNSITVRAITHPILSAEASWTIPWRRAEIPAAGGHGNARSVATIQSLVSGGGETHGKRLLSEAGCEQIFREQADNVDLVLGVKLRQGIGYGLPIPEIPFPSPRTCFWGGWGGSLVINDLDNQLTIAYVMNRMGEGTLGDTRSFEIIAAAYQSLAAA